MKLNQTLAALGLIALCLLICASLAQEEQEQQVVAPASGRSQLSLPKMFDFERFKSAFKKKYSSFVEEMARKKIFLGRAFRAFISFFKYKNYKQNSYLKINDRSDWTEAENLRQFNRQPLKGLSQQVRVIDEEEANKRTPVAELADIEAKLGELNAKQQRQHSRRRRSTVPTGSREDLTVDDLFRVPKVGEPEKFEHVESNNPSYEAPELPSYGAEEEDEEAAKNAMSEATSGLISSLPGARFVGSIFSNFFYGSSEDDDDYYNKDSSNSMRHDQRVKAPLPDEVFVDHRDTECFAKPKNQRHCGSCYIFSTNALYEYQYCKESGKKVAFSEQYPLDCGERVGMQGCAGGLEATVAKFYGQFGAELAANYKYRERSDMCPYDRGTSQRKMGYIRLKAQDGGMIGVKAAYVQKYLNQAPMLMGLGVSADFSDYGGGVDSGYTCSEERGHSMVLVGSGREDGEEYWLFRNSYGQFWGLEGHYKLNKKATNCLLDGGMGFMLMPSRAHGTIFDLKLNEDYDSRFVSQRYKDVKTGRYIPHNPYTYIAPEAGETEAVTPPSRYN